MCGRKISKLRFSSQFLTLKTGRHKFSAIRTFRIFKNLVWDQLLRNKKGIFISKLYLFTDYVKRKCQIVVFFNLTRFVWFHWVPKSKIRRGRLSCRCRTSSFFRILPGLLPDMISMERYTAFICSFYVQNISYNMIYRFIYLWRHNYVIMNFA